MHPVLHRWATSRRLRPVYDTLRPYALRRKVARFPSREVQHSYAGTSLTVAIEDPVGEGWYDHDWGSQPEIDLLAGRGRLQAGATIFDLGAHQAVVALMCAARVVPGGRVIAVEAEPHNVRVARRTCALNPDFPVEVVHAAVAAQTGTLRFAEGLNGTARPGRRAGTVAVPAVTIDDLAARYGHPDVVLLDVEGFEGEALRGATAVLASGRTDFFVEVHDRGTLAAHGWSATMVHELVRDAGAELWAAQADDGEIGPFARLEDEAAMDADRRHYVVALCR